MGTCILMPTNVTLDSQNALAGLRKWNLERDDSNTEYPHRVYRDNKDNVYISVTHILGQTAPQEQKDALERWLNRPNSYEERDMAAKRGTYAHAHAEYILKTTAKLARQTANSRGVWTTGGDCLERAPSKITAWAMQKAIRNAPKVNFSASGYARGLRTFIEANVTAIHAVEFSIHYTPKYSTQGFAGTCDCMVDIQGEGPYIVDWKTSRNKRSEEMYAQFKDQCGAYALGLTSLTGIQPKGAAIVVARRSGEPEVKIMNNIDLLAAKERYLDRFRQYLAALNREN